MHLDRTSTNAAVRATAGPKGHGPALAIEERSQFPQQNQRLSLYPTPTFVPLPQSASYPEIQDILAFNGASMTRFHPYLLALPFLLAPLSGADPKPVDFNREIR